MHGPQQGQRDSVQIFRTFRIDGFHLGVDKAHKLIRKWGATDAAVHDSQKLDDVLDLSNTGKEVWADSAYARSRSRRAWRRRACRAVSTGAPHAIVR